MLCLNHLMSFSQQPSDVRIAIVPTSQMRTVRHTKVKYPVQGHLAYKWQRQDLNPGHLTSEATS